MVVIFIHVTPGAAAHHQWVFAANNNENHIVRCLFKFLERNKEVIENWQVPYDTKKALLKKYLAKVLLLGVPHETEYVQGQWITVKLALEPWVKVHDE